MGNPNASSLEESASTPTAEPVKGEGVLPTISVTLGLALPDHTWVERKVEFQIDPEFEEDDSFDLLETSVEHLVDQNQDEMDKLAPSGWFLISWEWKN